MIKTLEVELADRHAEIAHFFYTAIYDGDLRDSHSQGCAFNEAQDNRCDCVLLDAYKIIKRWGSK